MIQLLELALDKIRAGETVALATIVSARGSTPRATGTKMLIYADGHIEGTIGGGEMERRVVEEARAALREGKPRLVHYKLQEVDSGDPAVCGGENDIFIDIIRGKKELLIVGAGHVGQAVAELGAFLDMQVTVFDDRADYASVERFPKANEIIVGNVKEELTRYPLTQWCYVVIVTRGHELDAEALAAVINSRAAYIGMIGSRRKTKRVYDELAARGIDRKRFERVHAPIGLDIGAETPEEIAISIMAEIISMRESANSQINKSAN